MSGNNRVNVLPQAAQWILCTEYQTFFPAHGRAVYASRAYGVARRNVGMLSEREIELQ
jgi:hypothetical protein